MDIRNVGDVINRSKCRIRYKGDDPSVDHWRTAGVPYYSGVAHLDDGTMRDLEEHEFTHEIITYYEGEGETSPNGIRTIKTRTEVAPL